MMLKILKTYIVTPNLDYKKLLKLMSTYTVRILKIAYLRNFI